MWSKNPIYDRVQKNLRKRMRFEETRGQPDPFVAEPDQSQASEFPQRDEWMRENSPVGEDTRDMYRQYDRGEKPYRVG